MRARYTDLIQTNTALRRDFRAQYERSKFDLSTITSNFAVFTDKSWGAAQTGAAAKNWKAHISVHPDDLPRAWDLIYPLLYKDANQFKVVDTNKLRAKSEQHFKAFAEGQRKLESLNEDFLRGRLNGPELESLAERLFPAEEYASLIAKRRSELPEEYKKELYTKIHEKYAIDNIQMRQVIEEDRRLAQGMQISIYMLPGEEEDHHDLFEEIETVLVENNIRPGIPYATDRKLGHFISIRHPGVQQYRDAVTVENYNPDNQIDPFEGLFAQSIQDFEALVRRNVQLLRSFNTHELMSETERHNTEVKNDLGIFLQVKLDEFSRKSIQEKAQGISDFQSEFYDALDAADSILKNDSNNALFKNLGLLLTGIGTLCALLSLATRVVTGHYLLFDDKESVFTPPRPPIYSSPDPGGPSRIALSESENHVEKYKERVSAIKSGVQSEGEGLGVLDSESLKEPLLRSPSSFDISS